MAKLLIINVSIVFDTSWNIISISKASKTKTEILSILEENNYEIVPVVKFTCSSGTDIGNENDIVFIPSDAYVQGVQQSFVFFNDMLGGYFSIDEEGSLITYDGCPVDSATRQFMVYRNATLSGTPGDEFARFDSPLELSWIVQEVNEGWIPVFTGYLSNDGNSDRYVQGFFSISKDNSDTFNLATAGIDTPFFELDSQNDAHAHSFWWTC